MSQGEIVKSKDAATTGDEVKDSYQGKQRHGLRLTRWQAGLLYSFIAFLAMIAVSLVIVRLTRTEIVVFDMKGTIDLFVQQSAQQKMNEMQMQTVTRRFNEALTGSLQDWQYHHHAVILIAPAVVSEQRNITDEIRADIARRMREE
ncbi:type-F conjugative transfer system protein TrbI [Cronobacter dublinensis]